MWRICNCAHPILGGCKRCRFATEPNRTFRGKRSADSQLPPITDSHKKITEKEQRWQDAKYKNHFDHTQSSQQTAKRTTEIYAKQHQPNKMRTEINAKRNSSAAETEINNLLPGRKSEIYPRRNVARNRATVKTSWYGGSKKIFDRLKLMLCDKTQREEFYDCEETSSGKGDIFETADNISNEPKTMQIGGYMKANNSTHLEECPELEKCKPSNKPTSLQHKNTNPSKLITSPTKNVYQKNTRNDNAFAEPTIGTQQKIDVYPGKLRCPTCEAERKLQMQKSNQPHSAYCKVNAVQFKNSSETNKSTKPKPFYGCVTPAPPSNIQDFHTPPIDFSIPCARCYQEDDGNSSPFITDALPESITECLNNEEEEEEPIKEQNILFNKLKALPFGQSSNKKDTYSTDRSLNDDAKRKADLEKLYSKVKKCSNERWGYYSPNRKLEEALEQLRNLEMAIDGGAPKKALFSTCKHLENVTEYINKTPDNRRHLEKHFAKDEHMGNMEAAVCAEALHAKMLADPEKKPSHSECELEPIKKQSVTKIGSQDSRQEKAKRVNQMQNVNKKMYMESWRAQQLKFNNKADKEKPEKHPNELKMLQLEDKVNKAKCNYGKQSDIDYITSEVTQIDSIIKQCEILRTKYAMRLEDERAKSLQNKFKRNNGGIQSAGSLLRRKCVEAMEKQKEAAEKKQFVLQRLREYLEGDQVKSQPANKCNVCQVNKQKKEVQLNKCKENAKKKNVDEYEKLCHKARNKVAQLDKKCKETERKNKEAEISKKNWEMVLWRRCRDAEFKRKQAENMKKTQEAVDRKKCIETEKTRLQSELQKSQARNSQRKKDNIEKFYKEAKKKIADVEKQLKKTCDGQQKGKSTDNTDDGGLIKFKLFPWHRHNSGIFVTPSVFQWDTMGCPVATRSLDSRCQLLGSQNQRGKIKIGGLLDALGIPFTRRLDSKFYLFDLQNRLACADYAQQQRQGSIIPDEYDGLGQHRNESFIVQWVQKFAELPLQLRPGSNILLPLPHYKGGYFIGENDGHSALKWPDLTVYQESEYSDSDS